MAKTVDMRAETSLADDWRREVKVTMQGPIYLSLVATNGFFCGGAHPYMFTEAVVFTLETGDTVDPIKWFKPGSHVSYADVDEPGPPLERSISAPDLMPTYKELTKHDCDDHYKESQPFLIWPDATTGRVMIEAMLCLAVVRLAGMKLRSRSTRPAGLDLPKIFSLLFRKHMIDLWRLRSIDVNQAQQLIERFGTRSTIIAL